MAGSPKKRARREAGGSTEPGSRAPAPRRAAAATKRPPGQAPKAKRGPDKPRFAPASDDDFALVEQGVARAAAAAEQAAKAQTPAQRAEALDVLGLRSTGKAADDRAMLAAAARVRRDEGIAAAWALGLTAPTIAARFNISGRQVDRVLDAHRARRARLPLPASSELLHDALDALEGQMERLTLLASREQAADAAKVGALRTWQTMWLSRLELLQVMGAVSQAPSSEARLARARDLLRSMLDALRAEGVGQDVLDRVATRVLEDGDDLANVISLEART